MTRSPTMTRRPDPDLILTPAEVADRLGVPYETLRNWQRLAGYPAPLKASTGRGIRPLYWWPDVEMWARQAGKIPDPEE